MLSGERNRTVWQPLALVVSKPNTMWTDTRHNQLAVDARARWGKRGPVAGQLLPAIDAAAAAECSLLGVAARFVVYINCMERRCPVRSPRPPSSLLLPYDRIDNNGRPPLPSETHEISKRSLFASYLLDLPTAFRSLEYHLSLVLYHRPSAAGYGRLTWLLRNSVLQSLIELLLFSPFLQNHYGLHNNIMTYTYLLL